MIAYAIPDGPYLGNSLIKLGRWDAVEEAVSRLDQDSALHFSIDHVVRPRSVGVVALRLQAPAAYSTGSVR